MKTNSVLLMSILASSALLLVACGKNERGCIILTTWEDSVQFAKDIIGKYHIETGPATGSFTGMTSAEKAEFGVDGTQKFNPVDYAIIKAFAENYKSFPLITKPDGTVLKGFFIDENGLTMLKHNSKYKQIYLAFGKRSNSESNREDYTVMIIPLDKDRKLISKGPANRSVGAAGQDIDNNYDELDPCPDQCPDEPDLNQK